PSPEGTAESSPTKPPADTHPRNPRFPHLLPIKNQKFSSPPFFSFPTQQSIHPLIQQSTFSRRRRIILHHQRNTRQRLVIKRDVDRIKPLVLELKLLNIDDEIPRPEMKVVRQRHFNGNRRKVRHDAAPVRIDEIHAQIVLPFIAAKKRDSQRDRTLRVYGGQL